MTLPVFLVDSLPFGDRVILDGPEGRHAAIVRRMRAGEQLLLGDGYGTMALCQIESVADAQLRLAEVDRWYEPEPDVRVTLVQALAKGDRAELAVELATEAGIDAIVPWRAARCVTKWETGAKETKALKRWQDTAREAAKQARRAWVPQLLHPVDLAGLVAHTQTSATTLVLHESATTSIAAVDLPIKGDILMVVGPEGGIADHELDALTKANAHIVRLGPTVLRTSTAASVALGALGILTSRWSAKAGL